MRGLYLMTGTFLLCGALLPLPLQAEEEAVSLHVAFEPGNRYAVELQMEARLEGEIHLEGSEQLLTITHLTHQRYEDEVLEVRNGERSRLRRTLNEHLEEVTEELANTPMVAHREEHPLRGRTVTLVRTRDGRVRVEGAEDLGQDGLLAFDPGMFSLEGLFPPDPQPVGYEWTLPLDEVRRIVPPGFFVTQGSSAACAFEGIEELVLDRISYRVARIRVHLVLVATEEPGYTYQLELEGPLYLSLEHHKLLQGNLEGTATLTLESAEASQPQLVVTGPSELNWTLSLR